MCMADITENQVDVASVKIRMRIKTLLSAPIVTKTSCLNDAVS